MAALHMFKLLLFKWSLVVLVMVILGQILVKQKKILLFHKKVDLCRDPMHKLSDTYNTKLNRSVTKQIDMDWRCSVAHRNCIVTSFAVAGCSALAKF